MKLTAEGIAVIEGDTYLSREIIEKGRLDVASDFLEQFRQYIPQGSTVLDVGASLGDYTATFSEMAGPQGRVTAYEPNPSAFECLRFNMRDFENVDCFNFGFGGVEPVMAKVIPDHNNSGASRLEYDPAGTIRIFPLDGFEFRPTVTFIKIDAEGWEPLILDGACATIAKYRPVMLIEVCTWPLAKMGFTAEDVFSRLDALNYKFPRFDGPFADILCIPKEKT